MPIHSTIYNNIQIRIDNYARFIHFTTKEGLSNNQILNIQQDKYGRMWFATLDGLTLFDGLHYIIYKNRPEQSNSLSDNKVTSLAEDKYGNLWIGTQNGLNKFDYKTHSFTRYFSEKDQDNSLRNNHIKALYADKEGYLWIECDEGYLSKLDLQTQEWKHGLHISNPIEGKYFYHHIFEDSNQNLWAGGRLTSITLAPKKDITKLKYPIQNKDEVYFEAGCFVETSDRKLLCADYDGTLGCYNPDSGFFHTILHLPIAPTSAIRDNKGIVWIGGDLKGIVQLDLKNNIYRSLQNNPNEKNSLLSNNVSCLYKDRDGNIWVGTDRGISLYSFDYNAIRHYRRLQDINSPSSNSITALLQDKDGLIWVGTENEGVDTFSLDKEQFGNLTYNLLTKEISPAAFEREKQTLMQYFRHEAITSSTSKNEAIFDSYQTYIKSPLKFVSLNENKISALYEDKFGKIYIGLWSHAGFNIYDKSRNTFSRHALWGKKPDYQYPPLTGNPFGANWYMGFLEDRESRLWCVTWEGFGLNLFDRNKGEFLPKHFLRNSFPHMNCIITNSAYSPESKKLYLAGNKYYGYYDYRTHDFVQIAGVLPVNFPNREIFNNYFQYCKGELVNLPFQFRNLKLLPDKKGHIWLAGHDFIACHTLATNQVKTILQFDREMHFTLSLAPDSNAIYLSIHNKLYLLTNEQTTLKGEIPSKINVMFTAPNGELWLGTDSGVYTCNVSSGEICPFPLSTAKYSRITAITGDAANNIYIGTSTGLFCLQNKRQQAFYPFNISVKNSLPSDLIHHINCEQPGHLWISTNSGLIDLNRTTQEINSFRHNEMVPNSIPHDRVFYSFFAPDSSLWVSTSTGMAICHPYNHRFTDLSVPDSTSISSRLASCIIEDQQGNIWLGTTEKGINVLNIQQDKIKHYMFHAWDTTGIPNNTINSLFEDSKGHIWVGTEKGLCHFNASDETFTSIKDLADFSIKNILEDKRGFLWVTTNNGLFCLNQDGSLFRHFNRQYGFQDNDFTAACKLNTGFLAVGGINGFNLFDPTLLTQSAKPLFILFANFKIDDKPRQPYVENGTTIQLAYQDNSFSVDFNAIDFIHSPELRYRYQLKGFDKNTTLTTPPFLNAKYTNIPPGDYLFEVEVCNCFGEWEETSGSFAIHIATPWYQQVWFILLLIATLCTSFFSFIRYREKKLRLNKIQLEKLVSERTQALSEAIDSKNKFFSIISHDLKNPIQALQSLAHTLHLQFNNMKDAERLNYLRVIDETSEQTKSLLDNLLLWELSQRDILVPNWESTKLSEVVDHVYETFHTMAKEKNICLMNKITPDILVWADSNMLETILRNLISNAIKFSYTENKVITCCQPEKDKIVVTIIDYGVGIPVHNITNLFYPNNKLRTKGTKHEQGNGLGLIIVHEFITKMRESIQVESNPGEGSRFIFTLKRVEEYGHN